MAYKLAVSEILRDVPTYRVYWLYDIHAARYTCLVSCSATSKRSFFVHLPLHYNYTS